MWTYIFRRLLLIIPTMFGVTIISFLVMQTSPGDPLRQQTSSSGSAGDSLETRETYLLRKRDLKLDKPLLLNFRYFYDYEQSVDLSAYFLTLSTEELADELEELAKEDTKISGIGGPKSGRKSIFRAARSLYQAIFGTSDGSVAGEKLAYLRSLKVDKFNERLHPEVLTEEQLKASKLTEEQAKQQRRDVRVDLANAIRQLIQPWCEDQGPHAVPAVINNLRAKNATKDEKVGAIRCLNYMVLSPYLYTFSREATEEENEKIQVTWKILWEKIKDRDDEVDPDRKPLLEEKLKEMAKSDRATMFKLLQSDELFDFDIPFFAATLFDPESTLQEKVVSAEFLRLYVSDRVQTSVDKDADPEVINQVADNWLAIYDAGDQNYEPALPLKLLYIFTDTQYAHMVVRLVTFRFGRSALKPREYVSIKLWDAVKVSAPLMVMSQVVIYLIAIPLGIICAVNRGKLLDSIISIQLFFLYSVPAFVAAMIFLLFFCYGKYLKWFPMEGLHSQGADSFTTVSYLIDYLHHAFLPVVCLSLFSLAGLAMYARSSMLDVLGQDYIRTARAKGLARNKVIYVHAFRNALIPILTLFANFIPAMLGGSVLIEYLFGIPGMGRLSFTAIQSKDYPTLMALIYIQGLVVMVSILITDILYVFVDPRISFDSQGGSK